MTAMEWRRVSVFFMTGICYSLIPLFFESRAYSQPPDNSGVEVLTRGPVHEAYAQPTASDPSTAFVAPKAPPAPIDEIPPEAKPAGGNPEWISGYWSWDDDRRDYLWVSGVWRISPPGKQWVAGYWAPQDNGYRWIAGFWKPTAVETVSYYPPPPQSVEQGPTSPSPGTNYFWMPGSYVWSDTQYRWQPGYWAPAQPNWLWVPPAYSWTPSGYVYTPGYWDYPLADRGLMFAPVYFSSPVYRDPNYYYAPSIVVEPSILTVHLFCQPTRCHYYYGDYYGPRYESVGFYPWFEIHAGYGHAYWYDPIYVHFSYVYRDRPGWVANYRAWHDYYGVHEELRPPRTLVEVELMRRNGAGRPDLDRVVMARSLREISERPGSHVRLAAVSQEERRQIHAAAVETRQAHAERAQMEARGGRAGAHRCVR